VRTERATNAGEGLKVEKENTPLLWERIEHLTQSVKSVLGEGSSRRVSNCKIKKFRVGLVNPTYNSSLGMTESVIACVALNLNFLPRGGG